MPFLKSFKAHDYNTRDMIGEVTAKTEEERPELKEGEHPLQYKWKFMVHLNKNTDENSYEKQTQPIDSFDTVEKFWKIFSNTKTIPTPDLNLDYIVFKSELQPVVEADEMVSGYRYLLTLSEKVASESLGLSWQNILLALIGDAFDKNTDNICGIQLNYKNSSYRLVVWFKDEGQKEESNAVIDEIKALLNCDVTDERCDSNREARERYINQSNKQRKGGYRGYQNAGQGQGQSQGPKGFGREGFRFGSRGDRNDRNDRNERNDRNDRNDRNNERSERASRYQDFNRGSYRK